MKKQLLSIASRLRSKFDHIGDKGLLDLAKEIEQCAAQLPEDSVTSSETNDNENTDDGGIEVPKKPPPP